MLITTNLPGIFRLGAFSGLFLLSACADLPENPVQTIASPGEDALQKVYPEPEYTLTKDQTHNRFSRAIPPALRVPSGAVIEAFTEEASDEQFSLTSDTNTVLNVDFEPIHPLTGPVFVEGAEPGDVLKVTLHRIELGDWGWTVILPGFSWLAEDFTRPFIKTFKLEPGMTEVAFNDEIKVPLRPFPGVMGVAPDTDEMLSTIPPRANGGNMDDPISSKAAWSISPSLSRGPSFPSAIPTPPRAWAKYAARPSRRRCASSTR